MVTFLTVSFVSTCKCVRHNPHEIMAFFMIFYDCRVVITLSVAFNYEGKLNCCSNCLFLIIIESTTRGLKQNKQTLMRVVTSGHW